MKKINILLVFVIANLMMTSNLSYAHNHSEESEISARNLKQLSDNVLTGGQPSEADLKKLAKKGVKTIINFRGDGEFDKFDEAQAVESNGMTYLHIPIDSRGALNKDNVAKFRKALDASSGDAFLHCGSGNRVGALFALDAYWNQNKNAEEALEIGKKAGLTSLEGHVETLLHK